MQNNYRKLFLEGSILRALSTLAIPIILSGFLQASYQLTDTFWVGKLGAVAVAAVSLSFPVTFLVIALGSGIAMSGAALVSQYSGANRQDKVDYVATQTMMAMTVISIALGTVGYLLSSKFIRLLNVSLDVYKSALSFMHISFIGVIFVFIFAMFQALMRSVGQAKIPFYIMFVTVALNFILDPLFIFGWGIFPACGVKGAAIATFLTQALAALIGILIFLRGKNGIHLVWKDFRFDFFYIQRAFLMGFPASIELSVRGSGLIIMSFLVASFRTTTMAAYGLVVNFLQIVLILAMSLSMPVATLVGQNIGAGNIQPAACIARQGAFLGFSILSVTGVIIYIFSPALISFFIPHDLSVIIQGTSFIRTMCLAWGAVGVQLCIASVFRASGNMVMPMIIALISQWIIQFPLAYILSKHTSLQTQGLWWSFPITNIIGAIVSLGWFLKGSWKKPNQLIHGFK